jgi:hypothetical protein
MCRTPEIVSTGSVDPAPSTYSWQDVVVTYRCVNCNRGAHECPGCHAIRCDDDLFMSIWGSIPLACKVCQPDGIDTWMGPSESHPGSTEIGWVPKGQPKPWEIET